MLRLRFFHRIWCIPKSLILLFSEFSFDKQDISVGQRLTVFGAITNDQVSDLQMSASNGYARMRVSSLNGSVVSLPTDSEDLILNLSAINGCNVALYDFSGTGTSGNDAEATAYQVATGSLSLDGIAEDDAVGVGERNVDGETRSTRLPVR